MTTKVIAQPPPKHEPVLPIKHAPLQPWLGCIRGLLFWAGIFVYALLGVDSRLLYDWQIAGFSTMPGFLSGFLVYPGGPIEYCARLLAQGYANDYLGALLITAQCAGLAVLTHTYIRLLIGRGIWFFGYISAILALCFINMYDHRLSLLLSIIVGLLLACLFLLACRRIGNGWSLLAVFVAMLLIGYYLADVAILVFAPAAAIPQFWRRRLGSVAQGVSYLILAAAIPLASERWLFPWLDFGYKLWFLPALANIRMMQWRMLGFLPVLGLAALIYRQLWPDKPAKDQAGRSVIVYNVMIPIVSSIVMLSCLAAACYLSYKGNAEGRRNLRQDYYACHEQWSDLIQLSRTVPPGAYSAQLCYDVDFALFMTGRLGDELFSFPQRGQILQDRKSLVATPANAYKVVQAYLRLGRANDAEMIAQESIAQFKQSPRAMASLVRVFLVKNNVPAARRYLNALSYDLVLGAWARDLLTQLDRDSTLAGNADIQRLRRQALPRPDMFPDQSDAEQYVSFDKLDPVEGLLKKDPTNQMAFEYGMAQFMLSRDLAGISKFAPQINNMTGPAYVTPDGRRRTPVHFQEALAIYGAKTGPINIQGFEIQPETLHRMAEFRSILAKCGSDRRAAMEATWQFRKTYFFYNCFGPGDIR